MSAAGIIFSNIHDHNIPELTGLRTIASIPFASRYRLIDFTLSNMVNSDIYNVQVITQYNYQSLMDHLGSGKDWDLARRKGGIKLLPPNITAYANNVSAGYASRLDQLKSVNYSISRLTDDVVVLSDCDVICNIDLKDIMAYHAKSGADITFAVKSVELSREQAEQNTIIFSDDDDRITDVLAYPKDFEGKADIALNILVMNTSYLQQVVADAIAYGHTSLTRDVVVKNCTTKNYRVYKYDGYFGNVNSFADYYALNMELIRNADIRDALFNVKNRPVYTKVRNSSPTYYSQSSEIKSSLIADGCQIYGKVENSILFRGVKIGKDAVVKNCILMQDTVVGDGASLSCVVSDKNTVIRDGRVLAGAEEMPFYIPKGKML